MRKVELQSIVAVHNGRIVARVTPVDSRQYAGVCWTLRAMYPAARIEQERTWRGEQGKGPNHWQSQPVMLGQPWPPVVSHSSKESAS